MPGWSHVSMAARYQHPVTELMRDAAQRAADRLWDDRQEGQVDGGGRAGGIQERIGSGELNGGRSLPAVPAVSRSRLARTDVSAPLLLAGCSDHGVQRLHESVDRVWAPPR